MSTESAHAESVTKRRAALLLAVLAVGSVPALYAGQVGAAMVALGREIDPSSPYLTGRSTPLLYVGMPLTVLGAGVLVLSPGLILSLALGRGRDWASWVLHGFALSALVVSGAAALVQALTGTPLTGTAFIVTTAACSAGAAAWLFFWSLRGRGRIPWPLSAADDRRGITWLLVVPLLLLVLLTPKFFWESFNGDGAHTFEATRLLLHRPLPFWSPGSGALGAYPGMNSAFFLYPTSWFVRLFGEHEAGVRLPFLLFLALLYAAVVLIARGDRGHRLGGAGHALVWAGLVAFALVMSFSATYDPYCADIALPATQDTLLMACFLGTAHAFVRRETGWIALWALLTLMTSPAGAMLLAALFVAIAIGYRKRPWSRLVRLAVVLGACLALVIVVPQVLSALGLPAPGSEHGARKMLRKLRYVLPTHPIRLAFVAIPCGIYPLAAIAAWRRGDGMARALTLVGVGVFAMYYAMAFVSLHYFVPAMVLPLAVFWRGFDPERAAARRSALAVCGASAALAIVLALPSEGSIYTATRTIGEAIDVSGIEGYDEMAPRALRAGDALSELFPLDAEPGIPEEGYGGSALAWSYYAHRAPPSAAKKIYTLTWAPAALPPGSERVVTTDVAAVFVEDPATWERHRRIRPRGSRGSALFQIPRELMFRRASAHEHFPIIDLRKLLSEVTKTTD